MVPLIICGMITAPPGSVMTSISMPSSAKNPSSLANVKGPTVALIEPGQAKVSFVSACAAASAAASSTNTFQQAIFIRDDSSDAAPTQGPSAETSAEPRRQDPPCIP